MKFSTTKAALLPAIMLAKVATTRSMQPIQACVLLEATDSGIAVHSSDLTCWVTTRVPCTPASTGSVAISVNTLQSIWRTLPDGDVAVALGRDSRVEISAGRTTLSVVSLSGDDFPERPDEPDHYSQVSAAALADLIARVLPSVSPDESRLNLNGAELDPQAATAILVSTDGHRLTRYATALDLSGLAGRKVVVPRAGLEAAAKMLGEGDAEVGVKGSWLHVRAGASTLAIKLYGVTFPPWQQVVPKECLRSATLDTDDFRRAMQQAAVIAPEKTHTVALTLRKGEIELHADNPESGACRTTLAAETDGDIYENGMEMGLNASYLLDALAQADSERVRLEFKGELDPILVRPAGDDPADILAVVMPMRI